LEEIAMLNGKNTKARVNAGREFCKERRRNYVRLKEI